MKEMYKKMLNCLTCLLVKDPFRLKDITILFFLLYNIIKVMIILHWGINLQASI